MRAIVKRSILVVLGVLLFAMVSLLVAFPDDTGLVCQVMGLVLVGVSACVLFLLHLIDTEE